MSHTRQNLPHLGNDVILLVIVIIVALRVVLRPCICEACRAEERERGIGKGEREKEIDREGGRE